VSKHQLAIEHTVVVGDSADDARAAQACRLRFVAASYGYSPSHDGWLANGECVVIIPEFSQILKFVLDE
jgi:phosphoglycolate phosphatase-like HAD superfamily hydrolase